MYSSTSGSGGGGGGTAARDGGGGGARGAADEAVEVAAGGLGVGATADFPGNGCDEGFGREAAGFCREREQRQAPLREISTHSRWTSFPQEFALRDWSDDALFLLGHWPG